MGRVVLREQQTESHWLICPRRREGRGWFGSRTGSASWAVGGGQLRRWRQREAEGWLGLRMSPEGGLLEGPRGPAAASVPFPGRRALEPGAEEAGGEDVASVGDLGGHGTSI